MGATAHSATGAYTPVRNPIAVLPDLSLWRLVTPDSSIVPVMAVMVGAAASVIGRVRRAQATERQQLRWFATSLDITTVTNDPRGTVLQAVHPSSLGLWIREARP